MKRGEEKKKRNKNKEKRISGMETICVWIAMVLYGFVWITMGLYGFVNFCMDS